MNFIRLLFVGYFVLFCTHGIHPAHPLVTHANNTRTAPQLKHHVVPRAPPSVDSPQLKSMNDRSNTIEPESSDNFETHQRRRGSPEGGTPPTQPRAYRPHRLFDTAPAHICGHAVFCPSRLRARYMYATHTTAFSAARRVNHARLATLYYKSAQMYSVACFFISVIFLIRAHAPVSGAGGCIHPLV